MSDLINFAIDAAGGLERFQQFKRVSARLHHT